MENAGGQEKVKMKMSLLSSVNMDEMGRKVKVATTWKKWGQESMSGDPNWHFDTLKSPDLGQGSFGQKHL